MFLCLVKPFNEYPGIKEVTSGYSGGHVENPTYEEVCTNQTGHVEAVQIEYDENITDFEAILDIYFKTLILLIIKGNSSIEERVMNL